MSRVGQFEEGKQTLVVGIDKSTLVQEKTHKFILGNNDKKIYEISLNEAEKVGQSWTNKFGKEVYILPVNSCKLEII